MIARQDVGDGCRPSRGFHLLSGRCDRVTSWASLLGGFCRRKVSSRRLGTPPIGSWKTGMTVSPQSLPRCQPLVGTSRTFCWRLVSSKHLLPRSILALSRSGVFAEAANLIGTLMRFHGQKSFETSETPGLRWPGVSPF